MVTTLFGVCSTASFAESRTVADAPSAELREATRLARATDYEAAEAKLRAIQGAEKPEADLELARIHFERGRFDEADRAALAASASPKTRTLAAALRARILMATGKTREAIKLLEPLRKESGAGGRRVKLELGRALVSVGRRTDAEGPLMDIVADYNSNAVANNDAEGLAVVGRAAHLLRSYKDANTAFNESERAEKKRIETLLWRSELFLEKYDPGHAEEVLREALEVAPNLPEAKVLLARVKLDQALDFDAALELVEEATAKNPKLTQAFATRAGLALRDMDIAAAEKAIDLGLAINPDDLELHSLRAAARFLADDRPGYERIKKEVFAKNAEYARFFQIVGEYAEWEHRYDDIVAMMKEAVAIDPDDGRAWGDLGLTQMRGGDETAGLAALEKSWSKDRYNVRVYNTLNLYEKQIAPDYELVTDGVFKVRFHKEERPVLERYVPQMLGEAWASMKSRYGFVPTTPVQVELYDSREQFSVRTSGLPNIGIQGVCFGRVVAAMSPKSEPFNWGNVLWHELGHVFAIQLSKNHVPRWFTEGLSEYETIARRPDWQRELDPALYLAVSKSRLPGAVDMNRAFTHAKDGSDVTVAYYAASQMLVFTVEAFGMPRVVEALKLWGEGVKTPDVLHRAFGLPAAEYDARFRAWALARLSRYQSQFLFDEHAAPLEEATAAAQKRPNDAEAQVELALALLRAHKGKEAEASLQAALKLDAQQATAHFLAAKIAERKKDVVAQEKHLSAIRAAGKDGYVVQMALADVAEAKKDKGAMRRHLEAAFRFDPTQSDPLKGLFDLAKEEKREADELDVLRRLAPLEQHDRRVWRMLLERLVAKKEWEEARRVGEGAVYVDVESAATHTLYARALANTSLHAQAAFELESALSCHPPKKEEATVHALLAKEHLALGDGAAARKSRDRALALDPDNAEAREVVIH